MRFPRVYAKKVARIFYATLLFSYNELSVKSNRPWLEKSSTKIPRQDADDVMLAKSNLWVHLYLN